MTSHVRRAMGFALFALASGCSQDNTGHSPPSIDKSESALAERRVVSYAAPGSRWRFDVPAAPCRVESTRFDPAAPAHKIKERFELTDEAKRLLVRVDVWSNSDRLPLQPWIDTHLAYLNNGHATLQERTIGPARVPALLADEPRSCQAANIVTAVFAIDDQVVAVTCADGESHAARSAFEGVLSSIGTGGAR